jgi:hypothetical protein
LLRGARVRERLRSFWGDQVGPLSVPCPCAILILLG